MIGIRTSPKKLTSTKAGLAREISKNINWIYFFEW